MKAKLFFLMLISTMIASAQVKIENGPALNNNVDIKMNRMLQGEDDNFYCYRIRTKGRGTSFYVEKYSKQSLSPEFSKEISIEDAEDTKIIDVLYGANNVYIFRRQYFKKTQEMKLYYQTVSSTGEVANKLTEIMTVNTDHYEFIDFDIVQSPDRSKFLVKASHKANKTDKYTTDLILLEAGSMNQKWIKTVDQRLFSSAPSLSLWFGVSVDKGGDVSLIGLSLDDNENVYYAYSYKVKNSGAKEKRFRLAAGIILNKETSEKIVELPFDDDYWVKGIRFSKTPNDELVIGGFIKDVIERKGRDLIKVGIFSFKVDVSSATVISQSVKMFDINFLKAMRASIKRPNFEYKLDYIIPVGKDVFYIGEKYDERIITSYNGGAMGGGFGTGTSSTHYNYEYQDVIVAKLNSSGEFEWMKNIPVRIDMTLSYPHIFKQYIATATESNIYVFFNENQKNSKLYSQTNIDPDDYKSMTGIHGSNFVGSQISCSDGTAKHFSVFENEKYCFAPIQEKDPNFFPPSDCEIFVKDNKNDIYIYTEDRGKDRFTKLALEE